MAVKTSSKALGARVASERGTGSRFAALALTGLGVLVIAACAVLLSYNGIYQIARQGNIDPEYAHLYPGAFTLLLLMAFWTSYLLRAAPRSRRLWVDALILVMILLGAGASALRSLDLVLLTNVAVVVTAVAPWVALLVAFRIFLWVWMHLRGEASATASRSGRGARSADRSEDREVNAPTPHPLDSVGFSAEEDPVAPQREDGTAPLESTPRDEKSKAAAAGPALLWPRSQEARGSASTESTVRVLRPAEVEELRAEVTTPLPAVSADPETEPVGGDGLSGVPGSLGDQPIASARPAEPAEPAAVPAKDTATSRDGQGLGETGPRPADEQDDRPFAVVRTPAGELPKRIPRTSTNPIKKAAEAAPRVGGVSADGSFADSNDSSTDGGLSGAAPMEDGFVHDPPVSDPTSDEADADLLPADGAAHGRSRPAADAEDFASPAGSAVSAALPIEKRPLVLKPRRTPISGFPSDPPSHHVRSEPTPPQE